MKNDPPERPPGLFEHRLSEEGKMRDPLSADWNRALEGRAAAQERSPAEDDGILNLIDFNLMNEVLRNWLQVVGIPCAIIDLKGHVLASSKWQRICMDFHRANHDTLQRCLESDTLLARQMQEGKDYAIYKCRNGLTDCASPIIVEGRHIANFFTGQFLLAPADLDYFRNQAAEFGFDQKEYLDAVAALPIVPEERLPGIVNLLASFARIIASLSLAHKRALSAQRGVERQVEERTAELAAVNRELEAFSYSVSHDLRAPLRAIDGFAKIIQSRYAAQLPPEGRELFAFVIDNAARMNKLITDLLAFSRIRHTEMDARMVDMKALVKEVVEELRPVFAGRDVALEIGDLPPAHGDIAMLHQAVTNLISNAIKFTKTRPKALITVGAEQAGMMVTYRVADNGVGFDMQYAERLFKVFQRLHPQTEYEGTGVGLALVKRIVERHGGCVRIESAPDKGTTAYITLPAG